MRGWLLAMLLLLGGLAHADELTLPQALQTALQHHPALQRAREIRAAAEARVQQAASQTRPHLTVEGLAKDGPVGAPGFGLSGLENSIITQRFGTSIVFSDLLADSGRTLYETRERQHTTASLQADEATQRVRVAIGVYRAYNNARFFSRLVTLDEQDVTAREGTVKEAQARFRAGLVSRVDQRLAEASLAEARTALLQARSSRASAMAELNFAMGIDGADAYTLEEVPETVAAMPEETLEQDLSLAMQQRPELHSAEEQARAAHEGTGLARAGSRPLVRALATTGLIAVAPDDLNQNRWVAAGMAMTWPFFTGGEVEADVLEKQHTEAALGAEQDELAQSIRLQVKQARLALAALIDSQGPTQDEVSAALDALRLADRRYQVGLGNVLEVQQAQVALLTAQVREARLRYDIVTAQAALRYATGTLMYGDTP